MKAVLGPPTFKCPKKGKKGATGSLGRTLLHPVPLGELLACWFQRPPTQVITNGRTWWSTLKELEAASAINYLSTVKAPGSDSIPAEILAYLKGIFSHTFCCEGCQARYTLFFKNEVNKEDSNNYRGISYPSKTGKAFARAILCRLHKQTAWKGLFLNLSAALGADDQQWTWSSICDKSKRNVESTKCCYSLVYWSRTSIRHIQ